MSNKGGRVSPDYLADIAPEYAFFLKERTSINKAIVEFRMGMTIEQYLDKCIESVQGLSEKSLISGLGELTEGEMKNLVRHGLKDELISLLTMFKAFPSFS